MAAEAFGSHARRALATVRAHPRHVVLAALVGGLLLGRADPAAAVAAALVLAALAGDPRWGLAVVAAVLGGASIANARLAALDAGVLAQLHGRTLITRAILLEPVRERAVGPSVARVRLLDGPGAGEQAVLRSRAWPRPDGAARGVFGVQVGDIVAVAGRVAPLGFADAYQRPRNAHAAIEATRVRRTAERRGGLAGLLDGVRRRAEAGLEQHLDGPESALLRGMVLGADERLTPEVEEDFQRSGLAHILAVSGQNVMLLAILVLAGAGLAGLPLRARLVLAALVIAAYVPLTGAGPSIQRAGVMGVAGLVAALAGRPERRWYALLLAAAVTLVLNPRAVREPGWQLSFAAVAALLAAFEPLSEALEGGGRRQGRVREDPPHAGGVAGVQGGAGRRDRVDSPRRRGLPGPVADAAALTIAATLGTAPLMAVHFQEVSLAALPANLLAAPAIAPVMWLGVLAGTAAQVAAPLAAPFSVLTAPLLVYLQHVARVTADTPLSVVAIKADLLVILAGWAVLALIATLAVGRWRHAPPRRAPRRRIARVVLALALAAAAALLATAARGAGPPPPGVLRITFLDVGQGDATLIELDGTAVLVDTGKPDSPILTRLKQAGVDRLDALMLTHAESDHEGAAPAIIAEHAPALIVDGGAGWTSPVQRALTRHKVHAPAAGETITLGKLRFHVLWPPRRAPGWRPPADGDPNENALVMRLEAEGISVLLTADAESPVLAPLASGPVDVLKVPHHGSADPGLPALLEALQPRVAAIEVGSENTYGHPAPSTTAALAAAVPTVVRTDEDGTVRLHADDGRLTLER